MSKSRKRTPLRKKLVFALLPLMAALGVAELVARIARGRVFCLESFREIRLDLARRGYPAVLHARLGYAPRPSYDSTDNIWGTRVTIDPDGFRSNGSGARHPGDAQRPVVAVGDSYTFGDQVSDHETWPAYLEQELERTVKNGGVFGYSFGQTILRAEEIIEQNGADLLIVSLITADIERCEFSVRYAPKPFFEAVDGQLVLHNVPVPRPGATTGFDQEFKNALGHSAVLDAVLARTAGRWWWMNEKEVRVHTMGAGVWLSLLLVDRIASFCRDRGCKLLLVVQGRDTHFTTDAVLGRARRRGVPVLDLARRLAEVEKSDQEVRARYWHRHMSPQGNRWVAAEIAAFVRGANLLGGEDAPQEK